MLSHGGNSSALTITMDVVVPVVSMIDDYGNVEGEEILVRDVMSYPVITSLPSETVRNIAIKMAENNVGSVVIVDANNIVVGIITEGDIVRRVVAAGLDPSRTMVEKVMTRNPIVVDEKTPLYRAAEIMASKRIGHLPVVDSSGRPVGIVARSDIASLAPELLQRLYLA